MALKEELKTQGDFLFKYRSYIPLGLLVVGILIKIYQAYSVRESGETVIGELMEDSSIFFGLLGLCIRVFTVGYTPKNTSGRNTNEGQVADSLNTTGIYSLVRNPLYLGNYLMWLAIAMLTGNIWFVLTFSMAFWIYYERIVYAEEDYLSNKFGTTYLAWTEKTPPFLPSHLKYVPPNLPFSWKKVLKKEKNGLFALFLLFFVFQSVGTYVKKQTFWIEETWIVVGCIGSGILYLILKFLKKYTNILNEEGR